MKNKIIKGIGKVIIREGVPQVEGWCFNDYTQDEGGLAALEWARDKLDADIKKVKEWEIKGQ